MNPSERSLKTQYMEKMQAGQDFREGIMNLLGISRETFYLRMKDNSWTDQEKKLLSVELQQPINVLFPETAESHV